MFENADRYPFLRRLQDNHQLLTRDFLDIVRSAGRDALTIESTAERALKSSSPEEVARGLSELALEHRRKRARALVAELQRDIHDLLAGREQLERAQ